MIIEGTDDSMNVYDVGFLLNYRSQHPDVYNEVANHLWERFGIKSAELVLLITYYVNEERRKHE